MAIETYHLIFPLQDTANGWQGNAVKGHLFRAPSDANGGGITLVGGWVVDATGHGAGTAASLQLENWGTAGTAIKATGGTIAAAIGGTASPLVANTPKAFTFTNAFVDAGEWVVLHKTETNSADFVRGVVHLQYAIGK